MDRVPLLGFLGRIISWIWKYVFKPVIQWVTQAVRTLRTWVETIVRWVVQRIQDGWNYITRKIQETIHDWVEQIQWIKELASREVIVKEVVWDTQFVPFSSLVNSAGIKRVIQVGIAAGLVSLAATQCNPSLPKPTPTPNYQFTQVACVVRTQQAELTIAAVITKKAELTALAVVTHQAETKQADDRLCVVPNSNGGCLQWKGIAQKEGKENDIIANAKRMNDPIYQYPKDTVLPNEEARISALIAVLEKHKSELPKGFSPGLFLAMGMAETGPHYKWENEFNGVNSDGIMQVENGNRAPYTDTYQGIENNVLDAIDRLNNLKRLVPTMFFEDQRNQLAGLPNDDNSGNHLNIELLTMAYNAGGDPISTYTSQKGNPQYVGVVAQKYSSEEFKKIFGSEFQDANLAADLLELQARFTQKVLR